MKVITKVHLELVIEADRPFDDSESFKRIKEISTREVIDKLTNILKEADFLIAITAKPIMHTMTFKE
ncbi:MAG: hypothetical protein GY845_03110 [Planctomycetes bacterium]|nr:hypothetical protein [Planctomycetota bacterium]